MLHEGGLGFEWDFNWIRSLRSFRVPWLSVRFVLLGCRCPLASNSELSPLKHSYGYVSADDHPDFIAIEPLNPNPLMQHAG